jgi:hypothetical protein
MFWPSIAKALGELSSLVIAVHSTARLSSREETPRKTKIL